MKPQAPPPTRHKCFEQMAAIIKTVDAHANEMNRRWGFNRLPHIVPIEWTEKFMRQRKTWQQACFEFTENTAQKDLARVRTLGEAMIRAYGKLEEVALANGMTPAPPGQWEFELSDGTPIVLVRGKDQVVQVEREPKAQVWCLEEIAKIIERFPEIVLGKEIFPDAQIQQMRTATEVRELVDDKLQDIPFG